MLKSVYTYVHDAVARGVGGGVAAPKKYTVEPLVLHYFAKTADVTFAKSKTKGPKLHFASIDNSGALCFCRKTKGSAT